MRISKHQFTAPSIIFDDDLPQGAMLVLLYLYSVMREDRWALASYDDIVDRFGMERRTVAKYLRIIREHGWFHKIKAGGPKRTAYKLAIPGRINGADIKLSPGSYEILPPPECEECNDDVLR